MSDSSAITKSSGISDPLILVKEAMRQHTKLEPYNEDVVRAVMKHNEAIYQEALLLSFEEVPEEKDTPSTSLFPLEEYEQEQQQQEEENNKEKTSISHIKLLGLKELYERNRRILLAYHSARLDCISSASKLINILPNSIHSHMTSDEGIFYQNYSSLRSSWIRKISGGLVEVAQQQNPPKDLFIQIRVKEDCGIIQTENGQLHLSPDSSHFVRRSDVQSLIDQGLVDHFL